MDRDVIAKRMRFVAPRCISGFKSEPTELPEPWDGDINAIGRMTCSFWRLKCPCGCSVGEFLGYPLAHYNTNYSGDAFVSPLSFKCAGCAQITTKLDTDLHGYHAEACASPATIRGEGTCDSFACPTCNNTQFTVLISFFFCPAAIDLVEDEPEQFAMVSENLFNEFVAHGRCTDCGKLVRFTDFGKL